MVLRLSFNEIFNYVLVIQLCNDDPENALD
jgi:hypothetical protein